MKSQSAVRAVAARGITNPHWVFPIGMACFFVVAVSVMALS